MYGDGDSVDAAIRIFTRVLFSGMAFVIITGLLICKYGGIYCGWSCPYFSVVELINDLMLKKLKRITIWEKVSNTNYIN
ncbi:MAG: polyferredoxin [Cognaticolwellia sp.]